MSDEERAAALERQREYYHKQKMARIRDKDRNMSTRLERRRKAIRARWDARLKTVLLWSVGLPVGAAVVVAVWRAASTVIIMAVAS